jgi:chromosome segregation ATPase
MGEAVLVGLASAGSAVLGVGLKAAFDWLTERAKARAPATIAASQAVFAQALNTQAESFQRALLADRSHLEEKVAQLEAKLEAQASVIADLKRAHEDCLGENRNAEQRYHSLEAELRRLGVPIHASAKATGLIELSGGKATMLMPTSDKPPRRRRRPRKEPT